jgi:hypothetical protein
LFRLCAGVRTRRIVALVFDLIFVSTPSFALVCARRFDLRTFALHPAAAVSDRGIFLQRPLGGRKAPLAVQQTFQLQD